LFANCGKKCTDPPPLPLPASLRFIVAKVFGGDYAIEALEPANKSKCHSQDSAAAASATCSSRNNNIEDNNNALGPSIQSMSMWASGNVMLAQLPCFRPSCPLKKPTHFLMHLGKRR